MLTNVIYSVTVSLNDASDKICAAICAHCAVMCVVCSDFAVSGDLELYSGLCLCNQ